ncbi:MAG: Regulatory P domain of the subtilisin-like protein proprotein convertases and other protease, partial [Parcubacteria group bacterium GW2011_GWD2_42_14]
LTFNENVQVGTAGNIVIYNSGGTVFETIPYNDSRITFSTNTVTINPTASFVVDASYYVQISNTAIRDLAGNAYAGISNTTTWNFTAASVTYCTSNGNGTDTYLAVIRNVTFGTINNSTALEDNAYSDFTAQTTNLTQGSSVNLSVSLATDGNYTYNCAVWIDWNKDGDFADASESYSLGTVTNSDLGTTSLSPLSITVPTIATGTTRMRVSSKYNAAPTSCETSFDGEVEDYTVNVQSAVATPILTVSASTLTGFTYVSGAGPSTSQTYNLSGADLTGFPSNITVTASTNYEVSTDNSTFAASVNVAYTSATLNSTAIYVRLKAGLAIASYNSEIVANVGGGASTVNVTCSGTVTSLAYCTAASLNTDEYISNVILGTISNASDVTTYSDFTAYSTDLAIYSTTSISVEIVSSYATDQILIWIDWNSDADFDDAGETILTSDVNGTNGNLYTTNVVVPADAVVGNTRMRIRLNLLQTSTILKKVNIPFMFLYTQALVSKVDPQYRSGYGNNVF